MSQLSLDFSAERADQFAREEAASVDFSEERLCLAWITESDGRAHTEWWASLPSFARSSMLQDYRIERDHANLCSNGRMRPYRRIRGSCEETVRQDEDIATRWAAEIREAALARRPVPFHESDQMSGVERRKFRSILSRAFQIAGAVVIEAAAPISPPPRKRRHSTPAVAASTS